MTFAGFHALKPDHITRELATSGETLDLHNEWNLTAWSRVLPKREFSLEWAHVATPHRRCLLAFTGVIYVEVSPAEKGRTLEDAQTLTDLVYQELEQAPPFLKFWFLDETIITVAADKVELVVDSPDAARKGGDAV